VIGDAIRVATGSDQATGVVTQCYRVAGTPNYPSKAKRARGRVTIEPTRIVEWTGKLWDPGDLLTVHKQGATAPTNGTGAGVPVSNVVYIGGDESSLPEELMKEIRDGGTGKGDDKTRSALFHAIIGKLARRKWSEEASGEFLDDGPTLEHESVSGGVIDNLRTTKLN
jgi:hypothetical protein